MVNRNHGEKIGLCGHRQGKDDGSCSIDTYRIYDACRQKECLEDLRVLLTDEGQRLVDNAATVRIRGAKVLWSRIDTEEMPFHQGYFRVNIRYYFHCVLECSNGIGTGQETAGLAIYDKSVLLYGGVSHVSVFTTDVPTGRTRGGINASVNRPRIVLEAAEPVALKLVTVDFDRSRSFGVDLCDAEAIPEEIAAEFIGHFQAALPGSRIPFVTLGLFSIVRIERTSQIIVPACDSSIPTGCGDYRFGDADPCDLFRSMEFPVSEFFPDIAPASPDEVIPASAPEDGPAATSDATS